MAGARRITWMGWMMGAWRRLAWVTLVVVCIGWLGAAHAQEAAQQSAPKKAAAKSSTKAADKKAAKKDTASAQSAYDAGIAAFEAGKLDVAIQQLSSAISNGGLIKAQMAKALYCRGVAERKQGRPAQAIADLTSALWLKGALSESDRGDALQNRSAAYRDAGLPDQAEPEGARYKQAAKSAEPPVTSSAPATTAAVPQRAEAEPEAAPQKSSGGFFSSWFGGGSSSSAAPKTQAPATPAAPVAAKSWSSSTEITPAAPAIAPAEPPIQRSAAATPVAAERARQPVAVAPEPQPKATAGRYSVQIAALRNRTEAQSLAARVQEQHAQDLGARTAVIDETVMGNMGTLYRVRVGPFADANEPRNLCAKLKGDGLDCLLITQ
jgi:hypothetical protein